MSEYKNLFLITCSGTKCKNSTILDYSPNNTVFQNLSNANNKLMGGRRQAYQLITSGGLRTNGIFLSNHDYNVGLKPGPDLGGESEAKYLQACERYTGRFYKESGSGIVKGLVSNHHLLIISGLYGLVTPLELIQLYECNLEELRPFYDLWTKDDLLTEVLIDYIETNGITSIVDLTSQHEYRNLISWKKLKETICLNILHAHNQHFSGHQALIELGGYFKENLVPMDASEFLVKGTNPINHCCLSSSIVPPDGWPMEWSSRIKKAIEEWETNTQEFKSTLTGGVFDRLPKVKLNWNKYRAMKSISSLMNTSGGELFIGINDKSRKVVGIRSDLIPYKGSTDEYFQLLDSLVLKYLGAYAPQNIRPTIWSFENKPVLIIEVKKGTEPAYIKYNENDYPEKSFWIRYNARDKKLSGEELAKYKKHRFKH